MIGTAQIVFLFLDLHPRIPLFHYLLGSFGFGPLKAAFFAAPLTFASRINSSLGFDGRFVLGGFVLSNHLGFSFTCGLNDPSLSNQ